MSIVTIGRHNNIIFSTETHRTVEAPRRYNSKNIDTLSEGGDQLQRLRINYEYTLYWALNNFSHAVIDWLKRVRRQALVRCSRTTAPYYNIIYFVIIVFRSYRVYRRIDIYGSTTSLYNYFLAYTIFLNRNTRKRFFQIRTRKIMLHDLWRRASTSCVYHHVYRMIH